MSLIDQQPFFTRRRFLRTTILGGALAATVPSFIQRTMASLEKAALADSVVATGRDHPVLVVLQLAGGNDGLNTVVPYADDAYFRARPNLAVAASRVLRAGDYCGFHPSLPNLHRLQAEGLMSVVHGVGYPNPNRSHFRSTEIWHTASGARERLAHGWIGRYVDAACCGSDPAPAVALGEQMPQALLSAGGRAIAIGAPSDYHYHAGLEAGESEAREDDESSGRSIDSLFGAVSLPGSAHDFLQRTALDAVASSTQLQDILRRRKGRTRYPSSELGRQLQLVGSLIAGGMTSRIYFVSLGGFDTHANQVGAHARRLGILDEAVGSFCEDLREQGNFERVLLLTFSEFGRRVSENASGGTDHGAAAPMFLMGGAVKGGFVGQHPSLVTLGRGDLLHSIDFRSVYATLLSDWLGGNAVDILGGAFEKLPLLKS